MCKKYATSVLVIAICLMTIVLLYIAANNALYDLEENGCKMTYMFEYPEYIRIKLRKKLSENFPRYGLYIYGEGDYAQELRRAKPNGIPVLFIPGNAGSYRQVRSLASVALRKAESHRNHFNYFTIDFDEDFSGLYGGVLMDQVKFVHSCLRHIIRMYEGNTFMPESVIVIGHSMGGMIARALFTLDNFQSNLISLIITLGTPHVAPVIPFDSHLNTFYSKVNNFWKNDPTAANISIISLAGGTRDILVPARFSSLFHNGYTNVQYSTVTTAVPNIWLTIDHLALCWCKQLILVINRALFTLIDKDTNRVTNDKILQERVLRLYFGIFNAENEKTLSKSQIYEPPKIYNQTKLRNHIGEMSISGIVLIPVERNDTQFIALSNSLEDISLKSCETVEDETCIGSKVISFQALPISEEKTAFLHRSDRTNLTNTSYIMVSSLKEKTRLSMQFLPRFDINKQFDNFRIFSGVQIFVSTNNMFINISLPMIRNNFDVYLITVEKTNCESDQNGLFAGKIHLPWFQEDVYALSTHSTEFTILLKTHTTKPTTASDDAQLHVWKTDKCSLAVTIDYQFTKSLGRIFILYAPLIPKWIYFWIMIVLVIQLKEMSDEGKWMSIWWTVTSCKLLVTFIQSIFMLLCGECIVKVLNPVLGWSNVVPLSFSGDGLVLYMYDWLLPSSFIILTALVIFLALYIILEIFLTSLGRFLYFCSSKNPQPQVQSGLTTFVLSYGLFGLPLFSFTVLCSSIVLYFLTMVIFTYCCKTTMQCRQLLLTNITGSVKFAVVNKLNFSKLLLVLFLVICFQTTPTFVLWLKVLPTSWYVPSDPFITFVILLFPTLFCLLEVQVRKPPKYASYIILSVWCVGFLLYSLDKLPYIIGFILLAVDCFVFVKYNKHEKNC